MASDGNPAPTPARQREAVIAQILAFGSFFGFPVVILIFQNISWIPIALWFCFWVASQIFFVLARCRKCARPYFKSRGGGWNPFTTACRFFGEPEARAYFCSDNSWCRALEYNEGAPRSIRRTFAAGAGPLTGQSIAASDQRSL